MQPTITHQDNREIQFPHMSSENDVTKLHPRTAIVKQQQAVSIKRKEGKNFVPLRDPGSPDSPLSLLERMALGQVDQTAQIADDNWLNSDSDEHLHPPDWLETLFKDLREMPIKEPPQIDPGQLQKVKDGLAKLSPSNVSNEQSLLDTQLVQSLMEETPITGNLPQEKVMITSASETYNALTDKPTMYINAIKPAMPIMPDPITPIPPVLASDLKLVEVAQKRNSDTIKPNISNFLMEEVSPLVLTYGGICDHMGKYGNKVPLCVFTSKRLYSMLSDDIKRIIGVTFRGYVPFTTARGIVLVPVKISENMGISIHRVECIS